VWIKAARRAQPFPPCRVALVAPPIPAPALVRATRIAGLPVAGEALSSVTGQGCLGPCSIGSNLQVVMRRAWKQTTCWVPPGLSFHRPDTAHQQGQETARLALWWPRPASGRWSANRRLRQQRPKQCQTCNSTTVSTREWMFLAASDIRGTGSAQAPGPAERLCCAVARLNDLALVWTTERPWTASIGRKALT